VPIFQAWLSYIRVMMLDKDEMLERVIETADQLVKSAIIAVPTGGSCMFNM
jgi:hypothetical protein